MYELRECIDCHETYEAFILDNGGVAGSGRCPNCKQVHLAKAQKETEPAVKNSQFKSVADFLHVRWEVRQTCVKCQEEYDAEYGFNVVGQKIDHTEGRCPKCFEVYHTEKEQAELRAKKEAVDNKREEWRKKCGIPNTYMGERFSTWVKNRPGNVDKIREVCEKYASDYPFMTPQHYQSLVITSPKIWGLGKTHLVSSIAHAILDRWNGSPLVNPIMMVLEPELFPRIRATYHEGEKGEPHETEEKIIKMLTWTPLLIIDDIGKYESESAKFRQGILFRVINGRYNNNGLPIVLTANMTKAEFKNYLGGDNEAILDRLMEMCHSKMYEVTGESFRRGENKKNS